MCCCAPIELAHAQQSALVFMTAAPQSRPNVQVAAAMHAAFASHPELSLLDEAMIAQRLTAQGFVNAAQPSNTSVRRVLAREADELLQAVAFGYDAETVARGEVLLDEHPLERGAHSVSDADARALTDICLYVVRALEHRGDAARARQRARDCYVLVPDLSVSEQVHPPSIRELAITAKQAPAPGRLLVRMTGQAERACELRVQGRPVGHAQEARELVPGSYLVQADCEKPGLVHRVDVRTGETSELQVDVAFEQGLGLASDGVTYALLPTAADARAHAARLSRLAELLGVETLWLVTSNDEELSIVRHDAAAPAQSIDDTRMVALWPRASLVQRIEHALAALSCGRACREEVANQGVGPLEITVVSVGGAAVLGSWALLVAYAALDSDLSKLERGADGYRDKLESRDALGTAAVISSSAGALVLATASTLWLPEQDGVPWWAIGTGALGALAAGGGAVLWLDHGELESAACTQNETCLRRRSRVPLGPMLVTQGAALLSIPMTYAWRSMTGSEADFSLRASSGLVELGYRAPFGGL